MKKASVSRSFRLDSKTLTLLDEEAGRQQLTVSALVSRVLGKYVEFGRYAERYGYVHIPGFIFTRIVASLTQEQLKNLSEEMGAFRPVEFLSRRNKPVTVRNVIEYLANHITRDCGFGTAEVQLEAGVWNVTLSSPWGIGFTSWARHYVPAVLKTILGLETKIVVTETTVHFSVPDIDAYKVAPPTKRRAAARVPRHKTVEEASMTTGLSRGQGE